MSSGRRRSRGRRCSARSASTRCSLPARPRGAARGRGPPRPRARRTPPRRSTLLVLPRHTVSGEWTLDLGGGRQVLLANVGPGHTGARPGGARPAAAPEVVFCGDLVEESGEPQAGPDAVPSRWPAALDRLLDAGRRGRAVRARSRSGGGRGVRTGATGRTGGPLRRVAVTRSAAAPPIVIRMRQYTPDLTPPWKKPKPAPEVPAEPDLVVEEAGYGLLRRGDPLRGGHGDPGGPLRQAPGVPAGAARLPAGGPGGDPGPPARPAPARARPHGLRFGRRPRRPRARGPRRAASTSRAGTTPSWSSGSGATTCASRAWSWSTWRASTTSRRSSRSSPRARTPGSASWWTTWSRAARSPVSRRR